MNFGEGWSLEGRIKFGTRKSLARNSENENVENFFSLGKIGMSHLVRIKEA